MTCAACCKPLSAKSRRTLGSSKEALQFLETYGNTPASALLEKNREARVYTCKPYLRKLENGAEALGGINQLLSVWQHFFGCGEEELRAVPTVPVGIDSNDTDGQESSSQLDQLPIFLSSFRGPAANISVILFHSISLERDD